MTPTSDERREVAKRLRATNAECESRGYPWMVEDLLEALGFETYEDGEDGIFDRLADLIDPTCTPVAHNYGSIVGNACPRCGWSVAGYMRYCPGCGARVVEDDGRE